MSTCRELVFLEKLAHNQPMNNQDDTNWVQVAVDRCGGAQKTAHLVSERLRIEPPLKHYNASKWVAARKVVPRYVLALAAVSGVDARLLNPETHDLPLPQLDGRKVGS